MLITRIINYLKCLTLNIIEFTNQVDEAEQDFIDAGFRKAEFPFTLDEDEDIMDYPPIDCLLPLGVKVFSIYIARYTDSYTEPTDFVELLNHTETSTALNLVVSVKIGVISAAYNPLDVFTIVIRYVNPQNENINIIS